MNKVSTVVVNGTIAMFNTRLIEEFMLQHLLTEKLDFKLHGLNGPECQATTHIYLDTKDDGNDFSAVTCRMSLLSFRN
jgi:hypothetical protein